VEPVRCEEEVQSHRAREIVLKVQHETIRWRRDLVKTSKYKRIADCPTTFVGGVLPAGGGPARHSRFILSITKVTRVANLTQPR